MNIFPLSLLRTPDAAAAPTATLSEVLRNLCYNPAVRRRSSLRALYDKVLHPCLHKGSHIVRKGNGRLVTVPVEYNDHMKLPVSDYFTALGFVLAKQIPPERPIGLTPLIKLLSAYAFLTRRSARALNVHPPTVVQLLWTKAVQSTGEAEDSSSHDAVGPVSLASSVSAGLGDGRDEVRGERVRVLQDVWPHEFPVPTPVQTAHLKAGIRQMATEIPELFGTPWGHCGESVSFASMYKTMQGGASMGALALSVKSMTTPMHEAGHQPVDVIETLHRLVDIVEVLRVGGAMRPMCLNCQHLAHCVSAHVDDYASLFASPRSGS
ncbi:hypothetical protein EXIGLDRAFT_836212 [Exidia glandulosa HHB12029]|uniref:Uncharacterized protein n=1 Tax=Exidia glandulosa HHB12029 TaxID=1314781 RepID=A0A165I1Z7_EXIGL|nr:hypothetical protein EXIGLDRAFT_836212 [Exidia glandulosa HHB12029]